MQLEEYLRRQGFNQSLCEQLLPRFWERKYQTGDIILNMGENTGVICLILKGIVRGYYLDENGNEVTKCFAKEGDWCCCYNYLKKEPSEYYIEALEECELAQIDVKELRKIIDKYPNVRNRYEEFFRLAFLQVEEKGISFQRMSAKERYLYYKKIHPDIVQRVKQEYVASYLGVTPSSLSRIKREL